MKKKFNTSKVDIDSTHTTKVGNIFLTVYELSELTRWSKAHIYKLTSSREIPHYKPRGKTIFFKWEEVKKYLEQNRVKPLSEIQREASEYPQHKLRA